MKSDFIKIQEPTLGFAAANSVATDSMPRDQEQSRRLHEPTHMDSSIDPITGNDIKNRVNHPHLDDGNLTVYFESDATHQAYLATPFNHPYPKLPSKASAEDDRGG
jgi:hypothetical protein